MAVSGASVESHPVPSVPCLPHFNMVRPMASSPRPTPQYCHLTPFIVLIFSEDRLSAPTSRGTPPIHASPVPPPRNTDVVAMTTLSSTAVMWLGLWLCGLSVSFVSSSTPVFFFYRVNATLASSFVCTSGVLSCDVVPGSLNNFTCHGLPNGTHTYYPGLSAVDNSTLPSFSVPLNTTFSTSTASAPSFLTCNATETTTSLPLTVSGSGLAAQYGQTCAYIYQGRGGAVAYNEAVVGLVDFRYSTDLRQLPTCPTPIPPTRSDLVTVGFTYVVNASADLRGSPVGTTLCGAGNLACRALGSSQFLCSSLINGTQYRFNGNHSSPTYGLSSLPLTGMGSCNGNGDGYLPPTREGLSVLGPHLSSLNCTQVYRVGAGWPLTVSSSYSTILGYTTFNYTEGGYSNLTAACSAAIPVLGQTVSTARDGVCPFKQSAFNPASFALAASPFCQSAVRSSAAVLSPTLILLVVPLISAMLLIGM